MTALQLLPAVVVLYVSVLFLTPYTVQHQMKAIADRADREINELTARRVPPEAPFDPGQLKPPARASQSESRVVSGGYVTGAYRLGSTSADPGRLDLTQLNSAAIALTAQSEQSGFTFSFSQALVKPTGPIFGGFGDERLREEAELLARILEASRSEPRYIDSIDLWVRVLLRSGKYDEAVRWIEDVQDPEAKFELMLAVTSEAFDAKQPEMARRAFDRARTAALKIEEPVSKFVALTVLTIEADRSDFRDGERRVAKDALDAVGEIAKRINPRQWQDLLAPATRNAERAGLDVEARTIVEEALRIAERSEGLEPHVRAIGIGSVVLAAGRILPDEQRREAIKKAIDLARSVTDPAMRSEAFEKVALVTAAVGSADEKAVAGEWLEAAREAVADALHELPAWGDRLDAVPAVLAVAGLLPPHILLLGYDLQLMSPVIELSDIPKEGRNRVIVADVQGVLHFHVFDASGRLIVDVDETQLPDAKPRIEGLKAMLGGLWGQPKISPSDKDRVIHSVISIIGQPPSLGALISQDDRRLSAFVKADSQFDRLASAILMAKEVGHDADDLLTLLRFALDSVDAIPDAHLRLDCYRILARAAAGLGPVAGKEVRRTLVGAHLIADRLGLHSAFSLTYAVPRSDGFEIAEGRSLAARNSVGNSSESSPHSVDSNYVVGGMAGGSTSNRTAQDPSAFVAEGASWLIDEAIEALKAVENPIYRADSLAALALAASEASRPRDPSELPTRLSGGEAGPGKQPSASDPDQCRKTALLASKKALKVIATVEGVYNQVGVRIMAMRATAKAGDKALAGRVAVELVRDILGQSDVKWSNEHARKRGEALQSAALARLVQAMTEEGLTGTLDIAEKILDPYMKARSLALAARVEKVEERRFEDIFEVIDGIDDVEWRSDALAHLAREAAEAGHPGVARKAARKIPTYLYERRSEAAAAAAVALARKSRFYEARVLGEECLPRDMVGVYLMILRCRSQGPSTDHRSR